MSRFIKTYSRRKGTYGFDLYRVHYPYSNFCVVPWYRSGDETCVCGSGQQFFEKKTARVKLDSATGIVLEWATDAVPACTSTKTAF